MATPASQLIQDQNINFGCDGTAFGTNTNNISKAQNKGRLGTRRALNDISNSTKPTALQASKKTNSSIISVGADDPNTKFGTGGKLSTTSRAKKQVGGRKALGDLTNSSKPSVQQQVPKKGYGGKISVDPVEEGYLHNHQECIKEQRRVMNMDCFHKEVGLANVSSMPLLLTPRAYPPPSLQPKKLETPLKLIEIEEVAMSPMTLMSSTPHVCKLPMSPISLPWMEDWIGEDVNFTIKANYC
nr:protein PATRONUS 2 [Ipomoea batatas]